MVVVHQSGGNQGGVKKCPLWVKSGHWLSTSGCPLCALKHQNARTLAFESSRVFIHVWGTRKAAGRVPPTALLFERPLRHASLGPPIDATKKNPPTRPRWTLSEAELFANSDGGIGPNAPVPIPHRLSARPVAVRRRRHVHRRRAVVTRGSGRSSDDGPCGKTAYESSRNIAAACADWRGCGTGECQHH